MYILAVQYYTGIVNDLERQPKFNQRDVSKLWRVDIFGGLDLLRACLHEFTYLPHTHEEFMIALTEEGPALPHYRGSDHLHGAQDILVLNPGEVHGGGPAQGAIWRYRAFYLPSVLLQRVAQEVFGIDRGLPQFAEDVISDPFVREMLLQAHAALGESSSIMERESRLLDALASLVVRHSVNKQPPHRIGTEHLAVKRAIEFLEITPNENISLEQLAQEVGLSPFHLCRVFHQATGLSPHAYQTLLRVRLAKTLLAKGHQISQVAVDAGFFDQAHLTRHFKRIFGVSPGKYIGNVLPTPM